MKTRKLHAWGALAIAVSTGMVLGGGMGPIFGAAVEVTNEGGGSTNGEPGSSVETQFNPTNSCTVPTEPPAGESLEDLLACVSFWIDPTFHCLLRIPGGSHVIYPQKPDLSDPSLCPEWDLRTHFSVTYKHKIPDDPQSEIIGLEIHRWFEDSTGSTEPVRLRLRETSVNFKRTKVELDRPDLVARITIRTVNGHVPTGGAIQVTINNRAVSTLNTSAGQSVGTITRTLLARIQSAGFTAHQEGSTIVVDLDGILSIKNVTLKNTDGGIAESELELLNVGAINTEE